MAKNMEVYSSQWVKQSHNVKDLLKLRQRQLLNLLNYDLSLAMVFNESLNVAVVKSIGFKDKDFNLTKTPKTIFINKIRHSPIKRLVETLDIVENHLKEYRLIREMETELYIPLFEPSDYQYPKLEGCLYLGSSDYKEFSLDSISDSKICNIISDISILFLSEFIGFREQVHLLDLTCVFVDILGKKELHLPSHSFNVAGWAKEIGITLGFNNSKLQQLVLAGLLHDIGKTMVSYKILNKTSPLNKREYEKIKEHSNYGSQIASYLLKDKPKFIKVPKIIKHHHERYDGKGYPDGLKKEEVPFESYIIGIADAVDVMLSGRPYKKALTLDEVIRELYENKGKQFHPQLVDIMVALLSKAQRRGEGDDLFGINMGSLILKVEDQINIIEGILLNYNSYYVFKPVLDYDISNVDLSNISHVEMAVKGLNSLNYYEAKIEDFQNNLFYISSLEIVPSINCFSLPWLLEGVLYGSDDNSESPINIVRVGGDSMLFYIHSNKLKTKPKEGIPLKAKILFDECQVEITGTIIKTHNFGVYKYFDFQYTNIPDSKRDTIYRQLFKKQIELRKAVARYS